MKRAIFSLSLILLFLGGVFGQFATNFTVNDCNGKPYDLFTELDAGKVIVLCWIMPCGSCILPATTAYNVARSYAVTHPGKVEMFVIDDYANTSCSDINNWCHVYGLDSTVRFSNKAISMKDYGTDGMPKTVVVSGVWHKVYFNQNNGVNAANMKAAIDLALTQTSVKENLNPSLQFQSTVVPNPMKEQGKIEIMLPKAGFTHVELFDASGRGVLTLFQGILEPGLHTINLPVTTLNPGIYYAQLHSDQWVATEKIIVTN
jgi:hypothetical protein